MKNPYEGKRYPWNDYSSYIRGKYGERVQKISVNTGLGCPNIDGKISINGCSYCNNSSFSPFYCKPQKSVKIQLEEGIGFFSEKYKTQKYLAYFQSFTNTYTSDSHFKELLDEAMSVDGVIGLVIATRPDSISPTKIELLDKLGKNMYISLEFGIESTLDKTLKRINRGHDFACTKEAFEMCRNKNFNTGAHLIMGLPGETEEEMLQHANKINELRPNNVKLHQLQILKNTAISKEFKQYPNDFVFFTTDAYIQLVIKFLEATRHDIVFERFTSESPREMIISPDWNGMKNYEFVHKLNQSMLDKNTWQGHYMKD